MIKAIGAEARGRTIYHILPDPAEPSRLVFTDGLWQTRLYPKQ